MDPMMPTPEFIKSISELSNKVTDKQVRLKPIDGGIGIDQAVSLAWKEKMMAKMRGSNSPKEEMKNLDKALTNICTRSIKILEEKNISDISKLKLINDIGKILNHINDNNFNAKLMNEKFIDELNQKKMELEIKYANMITHLLNNKKKIWPSEIVDTLKNQINIVFSEILKEKQDEVEIFSKLNDRVDNMLIWQLQFVELPQMERMLEDVNDVKMHAKLTNKSQQLIQEFGIALQQNTKLPYNKLSALIDEITKNIA